MKYICQLRDGYMLKELDNAYLVEETGYPYQDTELPSQEMFDNLRAELGIKDDAKYTISYLADVLSPYFGVYKMLSRASLRQVIETGSTILRDPYAVFFESKLFSVYYFEHASTSEELHKICGNPNFSGYFGRSTSAFVIHIHKDKKGFQLERPMPSEFFFEFNYFKRFVKETLGVSVQELQEKIDLVCERGDLDCGVFRQSIKKELLLMEQFDISMESDNEKVISDLKQAVEFVLRRIADNTSLGDLYNLSKEDDSLVGKVFIEIYGYNMFRRLARKERAGESFYAWMIGLYCYLYSISTTQAEKDNCEKVLEHQVRGILKSLWVVYAEYSTEIQGDRVVLLGDPYLNECLELGILDPKHARFEHELLFMGSRLNKHLRIRSPHEAYYEVSLDLLDNSISLFERKLFQYFLYCRFWSCVRRRFDDNKAGHTDFSTRNVIKTMVPNLDRLIVMGEISTTDFESLMTQKYAFLREGEFEMDKLPLLLDNALDEVDYFTDEEKSFIAIMPLLKRTLNNDGGDVTISFGLLRPTEDIDGIYKPRFRSEFLEKIKPVLRVLAAVYSCKSPYRCNEILTKYDVYYAKNSYKFELTFGKRG